MSFVSVQSADQPVEESTRSFHWLLVRELRRRRLRREKYQSPWHLQSRCLRFGPMISSVVALQTTFAKACPAMVFFAARRRSTRLCPPGCIVAQSLSSIFYTRTQMKLFLKQGFLFGLIIVLVTLFVKVINTLASKHAHRHQQQNYTAENGSNQSVCFSSGMEKKTSMIIPVVRTKSCGLSMFLFLMSTHV